MSEYFNEQFKHAQNGTPCFLDNRSDEEKAQNALSMKIDNFWKMGGVVFIAAITLFFGWLIGHYVTSKIF